MEETKQIRELKERFLELPSYSKMIERQLNKSIWLITIITIVSVLSLSVPLTLALLIIYKDVQ